MNLYSLSHKVIPQSNLLPQKQSHYTCRGHVQAMVFLFCAMHVDIIAGVCGGGAFFIGQSVFNWNKFSGGVELDVRNGWLSHHRSIRFWWDTLL